MDSEIYVRLRKRIDEYAAGFPATASGIEMTLLKKLFTPDDAEVYLAMTRKLEPAAAIASRAGRGEEDTDRILETMTAKGLTFPKLKNGVKYYAAAPFMHGFFEHIAVKGVDREILQLIDDYFWGGYYPKGRALRTVPVQADLGGDKMVLPYDDVVKIVESKERVGIMPCACASKMKVLEKGCGKPLEVCMAFDFYAEYPIERFGVGRWIDKKEALEILALAEKEGLVHQAGGDRRNVECICSCCSDCCVSLRMFKLLPAPSKISGSNYRAAFSPDACTECQVCIDRCPMGAFSAVDAGISFNAERCIGCGICAKSCPSGAIMLSIKDEKDLRQPPSPEKYTFMKSSLDFEQDVTEWEERGEKTR